MKKLFPNQQNPLTHLPFPVKRGNLKLKKDRNSII